MNRRSAVPFAALVLLAACKINRAPLEPGGGTSAGFRVVNGAASSGASGVAVYVDGQPITSIAYGTSGAIVVDPGVHGIEVRKVSGGSPGVVKSDTLEAGDQHLVVAVEPLAGGTEPLIYGDTNAVVPAGATKLRVVHAAALAPRLSVRRTQPDYDSLVMVMFPFEYQAASPYLQSTPGTWTVVVSHENQSDTLATTGPVAIPAGASRTVVIIDDGAGGVAVRVVTP